MPRPLGPFRPLVAAFVLLCTGCGGSALDVTASDGTSVSPSAAPSPSRLPKPARTPKADPSATVSIDMPDLSVPPTTARRLLGGDVSWPQCPKGMGIPQKRSLGLPMPLPTARYVIVGLTNGPGFTPNPCLSDQVDWVRERRLPIAAYSVLSYPDDTTLTTYGADGPFDEATRLGALSNVGYQQALFNIEMMRRAALQTPIVWLDVEPVPVFEWSGDKAANAAVVKGAARGYTQAGYHIGVYSTPALWDGVVGTLSLGGVPEWRAAGQTSQAEALSRCGPDWSIQGGPGVLAQWVADSRDLDVTCPGTSAEMYRWFHQF